MKDDIIYTVNIRVRGRRELLPDPQEIATALHMGGYPVQGVVAVSGCCEQDMGEHALGGDEFDERDRQHAEWVREQFEKLDAGTAPRAVAGSALSYR